MQFYGITPQSYGQLGVHGKQIKNSKETGVIKVNFLRPYCIAYLDQIILKYKNKDFKLKSTYKEANQYLKQCGFEFLAETTEICDKFPDEYIIKIQRFNKYYHKLDEIVEKWIEINIIKYISNIDKKLEKNIIENIWEIIFNGIIHGNCDGGITVCGQFYPKMKYFEVAFYDCGIGIPNLIKSSNIIKNNYLDYEYIEWALKKGTTTKPSEITGGLGLYCLKNFIMFNFGVLQIISGNGYYEYKGKDTIQKTQIKNFLEGTLVNIRVNYNN